MEAANEFLKITQPKEASEETRNGEDLVPEEGSEEGSPKRRGSPP